MVRVEVILHFFCTTPMF